MDQIDDRGATQVWCLWWPQNCIGGDESDWYGGAGCDDEDDMNGNKVIGDDDVIVDVSPRPLGNLREHLTRALSSASPPDPPLPPRVS